MYFKPEFKQKILDGTITAFVSKNIELEVGKPFWFYESSYDKHIGIEISEFDLDSEAMATAKCLGIIKFDKIRYVNFSTDENIFKDIRFHSKHLEISIPHDELGFEDTYLADVFYGKENRMTDSYLHSFELIDNKNK